ncbi:MAG TPA: choice-of-anchor tandem repeat GloVer-containing protein [Rhizomicrobium sp.]
MIETRKLYRRAILISACTLAAAVSLGETRAAPVYTVIYDFAGFANGGFDGARPAAEVTFDKAGNFYGTTIYGGRYNYGTVFGIAAGGTYTQLHVFSGDDPKTGGAQPEGGVIVTKSGDLSGTTFFGGTNNYGTSWLLKASGAYSVQHNFDDSDDGPTGTLLSAKGNSYGATLYGGGHGYGTIWKLAKRGKFSLLHGFTLTGSDGAYPNGGLVQDQNGNLYGTTSQGGTASCACGTVFRMAADGSNFTTLYSFTGGADGKFPLAPLALDKDGTLYGTTANTIYSYNCDATGCGTVWQLTPDGTFTVLHTFAGGKDGATPEGNLLKIGTTLYGTTQYGGSSGCNGNGCGTVYKLTAKPRGKYKILHRFAEGTSDGQNPLAGLAQGPNGKLYGTTYQGGLYNGGTVFSVTKK